METIKGHLSPLRDKPIEEVFLESLLKLGFLSILVVIATDFAFTRLTEQRSVIVNGSILFAILSAAVVYRLGQYKTSVLLIGLIILTAMFYQSIASDSITTSSMAVVMVVGFGFSVLLKGKLLAAMQLLTLLGMVVVFAWLIAHPARYGKPNASDIVVAGITYCILFFFISYSTWILKKRYDQYLEVLAEQNLELIEKTNEIETQNEELILSQDNLAQLNSHLEQKVQERTCELEKQNDRLIKYAFTNAHHVRGPVARLLGLVHLTKIDNEIDYPRFFNLIEVQAKEIDEVVKQINRELE
ncbi:MAG: hypothetical protein OJF59_000451 [Cytophagales bacterium]|jgi:hypothetical protein|nr:hypothetical protein [Bacteroidota bacterium]MBS1982370.1 hypothetical protein [Bacteroidota bacterium]WHZ06698.1 MAG: hypothetical protein OJF59_000451 [Cytophagales bacterium]